MHFRKLNLNLLVALDALLDTCSVTAAADRLNLSQAAVSNALARLREHFDDPLLIRSGRRLVMTDRARVLRAETTDLLRRVETRILATQAADPASQTRRLTVHAADSAALGILARLGQHLRRTAPGLHLAIRPLTEDSMRELERGDADLLVVPHQYALPDHPSQLLYLETFRVVAWQDSALARNGLDAEAYLAADHVGVELGPDRKAPVDRTIIEHGHGRLRASVTVSSQALVAWHVVGTERIGTLPASLAEVQCAVMPLVSFPLPLELPPMRIVAQWNRQAGNDATITWLRDELVSLVEQ